MNHYKQYQQALETFRTTKIMPSKVFVPMDWYVEYQIAMRNGAGGGLYANKLEPMASSIEGISCLIVYDLEAVTFLVQGKLITLETVLAMPKDVVLGIAQDTLRLEQQRRGISYDPRRLGKEGSKG